MKTKTKRFPALRPSAASQVAAATRLVTAAAARAAAVVAAAGIFGIVNWAATPALAAPAEKSAAATTATAALPAPDALPAALTAQPIVFVTRTQYDRGHHNTETFFPSARREYNNGQFRPGGALKIVDFKTGEIRTLIETKNGVVRDPEVHWDGKRILFSMRRDRADSYHIYEINADGSGLRQLTFIKDADDLDPFYFADDRIGFSSTREPKYCGCNRHIMANLYRMEADGANIHQISKNTLFDGHGTLLPDGRILYDRWEYVDRNYGDAQGLWTSNPDGTNHALYWGNNTPAPAGTIDARPIPGTDNVAAILTSTHERPWGALVILDRRLGLDGTKPIVKIWPKDARKIVWETEQGGGPFNASGKHSGRYGIDNSLGLPLKYEDPLPLNSRHILVSRQIKRPGDKTALYLVDTQTEAETLLHSDEKYGCYDPQPLAPRARPPVLPERRDFTSTTGSFYVLDVYNGTHMQGVKRGDVKYLRIVETPEKRFWTNPGWAGQGGVAPAITWDEFMTKRILGTVPVNADGSAYFEVPSEKFLYFQLLDKDGVMIQSMRSGTMVQPGEQNGCVGCHEDRLAAVPANARQTSMSLLSRPPAKLTPWPNLPGKKSETKVEIPANALAFSYLAEVQPVFDRYCVSCHNPEKPAGKKLNLTGAPGIIFNPSYSELWAKHYIRPVGGGPARFLQARTWGAAPSKVVSFLKKKHGGVNLSTDDPQAYHRVTTWIDLNAPYYASYATSYPGNLYGRSPLGDSELSKLEKLTGKKLRASVGDRSGAFYYDAPNTLSDRDARLLQVATAINFTQPEKSLALEGLKEKNAEDYAAAIAIIQTGANRILANGDNGLPAFKMCSVDEWREEKYEARLARETAFRKAILASEKRYDDEKTAAPAP